MCVGVGFVVHVCRPLDRPKPFRVCSSPFLVVAATAMSYMEFSNPGDWSTSDAFHDLRRQRRKEATHTFIVISTYYKHAECHYTYLYGDDDLRHYLTEELTKYYENGRREDDDDALKKLTVDEMKSMDLASLCSHASVEGQYRMDNEIGWGIRAIIRTAGRPQAIVDEHTARADGQLLANGKPPCKRPRSDPDYLSDAEEAEGDISSQTKPPSPKRQAIDASAMAPPPEQPQPPQIQPQTQTQPPPVLP